MYQSGTRTPLGRTSSAPDIAPSLWNHTTLTDTLIKIRRAILPHLGAAAALSHLSTLSHTNILLFQGDDTPEEDNILHKTTPIPSSLQAALLPHGVNALTPETRSHQHGTTHALLISDIVRSQKPLCLICWHSQPWSHHDITMLRTIVSTLCGLLELDALHRRVHANTHYDISSNLLNWQGFQAEITRRCRRLDRDQKAATFMLAYIPGLDTLVSERDFQSFEDALSQSITLLRNAVRPTDALSRLSGNTFGLWLDGGDRFAIAERAERMTAHGIPILINPPVHFPLHIGLVSREAGDTEGTANTLLERATLALNTGLREGVKWRFFHEAP
ncbi:GGDEF domain-containing protein [Neokomagataea anthophila]|uniref:Diguanylate cyclase n=1 Tax=Neokomagataea anthophila TaxID=2826925 RepID=A0ABS5E4A8_9PROT|nr:diguanylate cyclase [Neokomagataea anthophila]MBR0558740.1 diguanylate cyclase [Neokomagataea anthophila]